MKAGLGPCWTDTLKYCRRGALKLQTDLFHGFLYCFLHPLSCSRLPCYPRRDACIPLCSCTERSPVFAVTIREQTNALPDFHPWLGFVQFPCHLPQKSTYRFRKHCTKPWIRRGIRTQPQRREVDPSWVYLSSIIAMVLHQQEEQSQGTHLISPCCRYLGSENSKVHHQDTARKGKVKITWRISDMFMVSINSLKVYSILPPSFLHVWGLCFS